MVESLGSQPAASGAGAALLALALAAVGTPAVAQSQGPTLMDWLRGTPAQQPGAQPSGAPQPPAPAAVAPSAGAAPAAVPAPAAPPSTVPTAAPASPASASLTRSDAPVSIVVGTMVWQGDAALAPVGILNPSSAPMPPFDLACEFLALDRVLGTGRQRVPALRPGEQVNVTVAADVVGQLIDSVRCTAG